MKITNHPESHIVELSDGSMWQIFPGDIDRTLGWLPSTELQVVKIAEGPATHALRNLDDGTCVRARCLGERWPAAEVQEALKGG